MATLRLNWAGTASTTENNILSGTKWETLRRPSAIKVYGAMDTGKGAVTATLSVGNVIIAEDVILQDRVVLKGPLRNEDLLIKGVGYDRDLVQLKLQETAGTTTPARLLVDIEELA